MRRVVAGLAALVLAVLLTGCFILPAGEGELAVYVLDVGQGDSIFIVLPNGETLLIDAGERGSDKAVIAEIRSLGVDTLDYVVATHPHSDHIGGLAKVLDAFEVGSVYMPKVSHNTATFEGVLDTIAAKGLSLRTAKAGVVLFDDGELRAELLAPIDDSYDNLNNYSAVLMLTYGQTSFLFMGDAEKQVEKQLLDSGVPLRADVLKIGHHGSNTSSSKDFIDAVNPDIAVMSLGTGNSYGHPHRETLDTLNERSIEIWRTDQDGTVVFTSDGVFIYTQED